MKVVTGGGLCGFDGGFDGGKRLNAAAVGGGRRG